MDNDDLIKVQKGNYSKKKTINLKSVEPMNNIKVVRNRSPSVSSESTISSDSSISSDSTDGVSEVSERPRQKKMKKVLRPQQPKSSQQQFHNDYSSFTNPKKIKEQQFVEQYQDSESEYSSIEDQASEQESVIEDTFQQKQKMKQELLIKINSLEAKGFEFSKKYTLASNYEEMLLDYERIKHHIETQGAIKFSRRCLMACVTGIEFLNKKFDPFSVKLEGWSENVMESIDDYDNIFEKLHEKYSRKAEIAPELELLLTLGGSAFMFHLTNTLLKSPSIPGIPGMQGGAIAQNNPNFMQSMLGSLSQSMKEMNKQPSTTNGGSKPPQPPPPMETRTQRREMNGPSIDPGLFSGTPLMTNYPKPPNPQMYTQPTRNANPYEDSQYEDEDRFSIASSSELSMGSSDSDFSVEIPKSKKFSIQRKPNKFKKGGNNGLELNIK